MFGWRKKSDGFEWHEYVRTTIKLRRDGRKKKIDDLKYAAAAKIKDAGEAGAFAGRSGVSSARRFFRWALRKVLAMPGWLLPMLKAGFIGAGRFCGWAVRGLWFGMSAIGLWLGARVGAIFEARVGPLIERLIAKLRQPGVSPTLALVAVVIGVSAVSRVHVSGFDTEAFVGFTLTLGMVMLAFGAMIDKPNINWPRLPHVGNFGLSRIWGRLEHLLSHRVAHLFSRRAGLGLAAFAGLAVLSLGGWAAWNNGPHFSIANQFSFMAASKSGTGSDGRTHDVSRNISRNVSGRARSVTGDRLSIGGRTVRLRGIEAPELSQKCRTARGRSWWCGRSARQELAKIIRRKRVRCEITQHKNNKSAVGRCRVGRRDIAEIMVERGYAFAESGLFSTYGSTERKARRGKNGIWQGTAERPSVFRAARWARAKRRAPDGCPIKGRVSRRRGKVYVLPWSRKYHGVRIRSRRGERWFCTEKEAIAAGWRPAVAG